ncbi:hypothetical protein JS562_12760 [Agrobacterium sp. S2]|nr:hypothetical protein [Agrobacterium sp. S2]
MKRAQNSISLVRNAVRPFFGQKKKKPFYKNIDTVRSLIKPNNVSEALRIIEGKNYYPFPGLGNTFPTDPGQIPLRALTKLHPLPPDREILIQISRINHHAELLVKALESIADINDILARGNFDPAALEMIETHISNYGWSFVVVRKLLLTKLLQGGLPSLSQAAQAITTEYDRAVWGVYAHFLYDLLDPSFDPFSALMTWRYQIRQLDPSREWYTLLFADFLDGNSVPRNQVARALVTFGNSSLLDLTFYVWKHYDFFGQNSFGVEFDEGIRGALDRAFTELKISPSSVYMDDCSEISDLELYRCAVLFDEIREISRWRSELDSLMVPLPNYLPTSKEVQSLAHEVSATNLKPSSLAAIVDARRDWQKTHFDIEERALDQYLMRATVLGVALRDNTSALLVDRNELAEVIASTDSFQDFVVKDTLLRLVSAEDSEDELDFVVRDLLFKKVRSRDNDLERRLVFMKLVQRSGCVSISSYIANISENRPAVARLMAATCTRTFLERLFLLMSSIKDVISTRIEICEWLSRDEADSESISEEIASLKRELDNLDTRSDLDSTRIHVDEESLREWFWETQKPSVNRFIQTVIAEGKGTGNFSLLRFLATMEKTANPDEVKIDSQVGSEFLLLAIFSATLNAFASDKSFGLDAYLSRRIRHGSLSGSIITPLSRIIKRFDDISPSERMGEVDPTQDFPSLALQWRKDLAAHLDDARKHVIQLQANSDRGLISASWRTASTIAHVDAAISRIRARVIESKGVYDIFPDLYALCWDCIEPDLAQLRRYLLRDLLPKTVAPLQTIWNGLTPRNQTLARRGIEQLNATLVTKIQEVCGWFIRPVFRRDSYSLRMLVTSTLSIVRELDENYAFDENVSIPDEVTLNRASFDVFGDLLFVVFGNAAKYGIQNGTINVSSETAQAHGGEIVVAVQVQSFVDTVEDFDNAVSRIEKAMNIKDFEIAKTAVGEGFSGLGKAVGIIRHVKSDKAALVFDADREKRDIRFAIYLPAQIAVNRTQ